MYIDKSNINFSNESNSIQYMEIAPKASFALGNYSSFGTTGSSTLTELTCSRSGLVGIYIFSIDNCITFILVLNVNAFNPLLIPLK